MKKQIIKGVYIETPEEMNKKEIPSFVQKFIKKEK